MEIIYRSSDGQEFGNENDCIQHEKDTKIEMYRSPGKLTTFVDDAWVVYLRNEQDLTTFLNQSYIADIPTDGLQKGHYGWFYWDGEKYCHVSKEFVEMIKILINVKDLH